MDGIQPSIFYVLSFPEIYGKIRTTNGVWIGQNVVAFTVHLGSCCGASLRITSTPVLVLISEIVPTVWVPSASVIVSWWLTTYTRDESVAESMEIAPTPTVIVLF